MEQKYIDKFSTQQQAHEYCQRISQTKAYNELDAVIPDCNASKDASGYISTSMSGDFIQQYNSYEEAQEQCWRLHGYTDTVESQNKDMIVVESVQTSGLHGGEGVTSQTLVHKGDVQQYYIDIQEEEIERQNKALIADDEAESSSIGCAMVVEPAIKISVLDAISHQNISCKSKTVIQDGDFNTELDNINCLFGWLQGVDEREGNYKITVTAKNYEEWVQENVKVTKEGCHVSTKEINVYLNPVKH